MLFKVVLFSACVAVAFCQADKYPAGVSAALCPGYPHCDNLLLALHANRAAAPVAAPAAARGWPAGVAPAACPNYPYCDNGAPYIAPQSPIAREWPAGVAPAACPNYPYC